MYRNYYCAEVVILLLLSHVGWNGPSTTVLNCSRNKSRLVHMIVHKKILPVLFRYKLAIPMNCPFHSQRDIFWWPEVQTDFQKEWWICPFCGSTFAYEDMLISHWDNEHAHYFNQAEDSVCLATFCDIFRCDVIAASLGSVKNRPSSSSFSSDVHYKKDNSPCDERNMSTLRKKCKAVIRQCLLGLLATLSLKDFQDIEDELDKGICSYLTCNRYWDGSLQETHHVPILFCLIIGFIMIAGFCACYYIVWILFDSPHASSDEPYCNGSTLCNDLYGTRSHTLPQYPSYQRARNKHTYAPR